VSILAKRKGGKPVIPTFATIASRNGVTKRDIARKFAALSGHGDCEFASSQNTFFSGNLADYFGMAGFMPEEASKLAERLKGAALVAPTFAAPPRPEVKQAAGGGDLEALVSRFEDGIAKMEGMIARFDAAYLGGASEPAIGLRLVSTK
jgi:hypothetical protein